MCDSNVLVKNKRLPYVVYLERIQCTQNRTAMTKCKDNAHLEDTAASVPARSLALLRQPSVIRD